MVIYYCAKYCNINFLGKGQNCVHGDGQPEGKGDALNDLLVIRILFIAVLSSAAFFLKPFNLPAPLAAAVGAAAGLGVVLFEIRVKQVSLTRLMGAAVGSVLGI